MASAMAADGLGRDEYQAAYDISVEISVVLGKATLRVNQLLKLGRGAVVELDQKANEPVEVYANDRLIAFGQVIVTEGNRLGVTLTDLVKSTFSERPI
ncbi:MAG: flagellar motor switch protein FliN [Alphaproteobacteria bacterium]